MGFGGGRRTALLSCFSSPPISYAADCNRIAAKFSNESRYAKKVCRLIHLRYDGCRVHDINTLKVEELTNHDYINRALRWPGTTVASGCRAARK
ncbi:MAG: hypothetical protein CL396_09905 [Acidiferrobacteraceae bacterium]|jgi:hypothetical protein|nr:hypothetical protein [Acidiferrobacteraceae bacterium]